MVCLIRQGLGNIAGAGCQVVQCLPIGRTRREFDRNEALPVACRLAWPLTQSSALLGTAHFPTPPRWSGISVVGLLNELATLVTVDLTGQQGVPPVRNADLTLADARLQDSAFARRAAEVADSLKVERRALIVRTLLHLPRVADGKGQVKWRLAEAELKRCAEELSADQEKLRGLVSTNSFALQDLVFVADYNTSKAETIFSHLHYLRSARQGSRNYALVDPMHGSPVSLCSVSPLEWKLVRRQLGRQFKIPADKIWDVSRVYSFEVAPPNAISYLLARVRNDLLLKEPDAELLTTAVDPNLGFTGSSYRAANWQQWMTVSPRPYLYLNNSYVTPRQLRTRFSTANLKDIESGFGAKVEATPPGLLLDSSIFCCRLKGETEPVPAGQRQRLRR